MCAGDVWTMAAEAREVFVFSVIAAVVVVGSRSLFYV